MMKFPVLWNSVSWNFMVWNSVTNCNRFTEKNFDGIPRNFVPQNSTGHPRKDICCYICNKCGHYSRDCLLPKRTRKEERSRVFKEDVERIFWEEKKENNWKPKDFSAEETKEEHSVSSSINAVHTENVKLGKNHVMNQAQVLQQRVNNLIIEKRKKSFTCFNAEI